MHAQPQAEHEWLQQLVGEWTTEAEATMGPDQPPVKFAGRETVRTLGGLWVICEGEGEMPGGGIANNIITLGYDPARQRYVGTFVGSMMSHMWIYEGELDASRKVLTLDTEGPDFAAEGKISPYKDIFEIHSPDHRTLTSRMPGPDGQWHVFMTAHYHRKK